MRSAFLIPVAVERAAEARTARVAFAVLAVVLLSMFSGLLAALGSSDGVLLMVAGPAVVGLLILEARRARTTGGVSLSIPVILLCLPFLPLLPSGKPIIAWQLGTALLVAWSFSLLPSSERRLAFRRAAPVLLPSALWVAMLGLSYLTSDQFGRSDLYDLIALAFTPFYVLLAAVYCRTVRDMGRVAWALIASGLLQFPVVLAQALGWTDRLPASMAALRAQTWGGSLQIATSAVRYPGTFGDYELFAEYLGIAFLFSVGVYLCSGSGSTSRWALVVGPLFMAMGLFSGTRGFLLGASGGIIVMLVAMSVKPVRGDRTLLRVLVFLGVVLLAVLWVVPEEVVGGFRDRLSSMQLEGSNAFNRWQLFSVWITLLNGMPFLGYGTDMLTVVRTAFGPFLVESPHSLYFSMVLTGGYPTLAATVLLIGIVIGGSAWTAFKSVQADQRRWGGVLLAVVLYWAVNEGKIEFTRLQFYMDMVFFVFGVTSSLFVSAQYDRARVSEHGDR